MRRESFGILRNAGAVLALLTVLILVSGCLISGSESTRMHGRLIGAHSLAQVQAGKTSGDWLLASFGEPTSRRPFITADGGEAGEVWRYSWSRVERSSGHLFLVFSGSSHREEQGSAYFELIEGVVTRYWSDADP